MVTEEIGRPRPLRPLPPPPPFQFSGAWAGPLFGISPVKLTRLFEQFKGRKVSIGCAILVGNPHSPGSINPAFSRKKSISSSPLQPRH